MYYFLQILYLVAAVVSATFAIEGLLESTSQVYNRLGVSEQRYYSHDTLTEPTLKFRFAYEPQGYSVEKKGTTLRTIQGMDEREHKYIRPKYERDGTIIHKNHRRVYTNTNGKAVEYSLRAYNDDSDVFIHNSPQMLSTKTYHPKINYGNQLRRQDDEFISPLSKASRKQSFENRKSSIDHLSKRGFNMNNMGAKLSFSFKVNDTLLPKKAHSTKFEPSLWLQQIQKDVRTAVNIVTQDNNENVLNIENTNTTVAKVVKDVLKPINKWKPPQQLKDITGGHIRRVKDVNKITSFLKYILKQNILIFDTVANEKSNQLLKNKLKYIEKIYMNKYNEFINETGDYKIVGKEGAKRLARNAIDVSNHFTNKLLNYLAEHVDEKELLKDIYRKFENGTDETLKNACLNLGVCQRSDSGFIALILDVLIVMLSVNDDKFIIASNSMVKTAKSTDYTDVFGDDIDKCIHRGVNNFDSTPSVLIKAGVMIVKNIIANRNMPLVINADTSSSSTFVNKTLAFKDIVNIFNDKVPNSDVNKTKWSDIQIAVRMWAADNSIFIDNTVSTLMTHLKDIVRQLDKDSQGVIKNRLDTICK